MREALRKLDPNLPLYDTGSMTQLLGFAYFSGRAAALALRGVVPAGQNITKPEAITLNFFAGFDSEVPAKHWPCIYKGMKLAILSAGINSCRKVIQKRLVKIASSESRRELFGINAGKPGAKTGGDHLARKFMGRIIPNRENRFQACGF